MYISFNNKIRVPDCEAADYARAHATDDELVEWFFSGMWTHEEPKEYDNVFDDEEEDEDGEF